MIEDLMEDITQQIATDALLARQYVVDTALAWGRRYYEEELHEFLQRVGLAHDLRWWKP